MTALYSLSRYCRRRSRDALCCAATVGEVKFDMTKERSAFKVQHPSGLLIQQGIRESDVRAIPDVRTRDMGNGYVWYYLPRAEISGNVVAIGLCFFKQSMNFLTAVVVDDDPADNPWSNWSAEKERARLEATRQWFANVGYPVGEYKWGIVFAENDMKTGDASGGVRFQSRAKPWWRFGS